MALFPQNQSKFDLCDIEHCAVQDKYTITQLSFIKCLFDSKMCLVQTGVWFRQVFGLEGVQFRQVFGLDSCSVYTGVGLDRCSVKTGVWFRHVFN